jgi:ABC-type multidrug transport system ATPase subunit
MLEKTSGKIHSNLGLLILVFDQDLSTSIDEIRKYTGFCSQKDILYDELTVEEHLEFFGKIKGLTNKQDRRSQIDYIIE